MDARKKIYTNYTEEDRRSDLIEFIAGLNTLAKQIKNRNSAEKAFFKRLNEVRDGIPDAIVLIQKILTFSIGYGAVFSTMLMQSKE